MAAEDENRSGEAEAPEQTGDANDSANATENDGHIDPETLLGQTDTDTLLDRSDVSKDFGSGSTGVGQEYFGGTNAPGAREQRGQEASEVDAPEDADHT